jgi:hypothetical protein
MTYRGLYNQASPDAADHRGFAGRAPTTYSTKEHRMIGTPFSRCLALTVLAAMTALVSTTPGAESENKENGFKPLFNGKNFAGWKFELGKADPEKTYHIKKTVIICTGQPNGYFYTAKKYKNYVIRYDWKYVKPPEGKKSSYNSGLLIHIHPPQKVWPKCVEVQGANANHGVLYFLECKKLASKYDQETKNKVTKPIGQWNTTEATCRADGSITAKINGTEVSSGKSDLTEGQIGFQSEGAEIHFRNIRIKQLEE